MKNKLYTKNIKLKYGDSIVLNDINISIPNNKITALVGHNGCGKSTLLKCIARVIKPNSGYIIWENKSIANIKANEMSKNISILFQKNHIPDLVKVFDIVSYGRNPYTGFFGHLSEHDKQIINNAMKFVGIEDLQDKYISELSGGQQQRAFLAMTVAQDTEYILLDEPTSYLDINHAIELMNLLKHLKSQGKTILVVLHDLNQAFRYCDNIIFMKNGEIIKNCEITDMLDSNIIKDVFDVESILHNNEISNTKQCTTLK